MVEDIRFDGKAGRPSAMFLKRGCKPITYIANYRFWKSAYREDEEQFLRYFVTCLSHETLHVALYKVHRTANRSIDRRRLFGELTTQEHPIGLRVPVA